MTIELTPKLCPQVFSVLNQALEDKVFSGCQFGVWSKQFPTRFFLGTLGEKHREIEAIYPQGEARKITHSTFFDLSSLTKVISTTTLCALLVERGWLQWSTPVSKYFPEKHFQGIELWHLLSHTAGLKWWSPYFEEILKTFPGQVIEKVSISERQKKMRSLVLNEPLVSTPGSQAVYSDLSMLLLGFLIEEIAQRDLDEVFYDWIQKPLGLKNIFYKRVEQSLSVSIDARCAATENSVWRGGVLEGVVHDDNTYAMGGYSGHSGLFGSALEVLRFTKELWSGFLMKATLKKIWTPVSGIPNSTRALGWDTPSAVDSSVGHFFSKNSVGHLGFTGTSLWLDLDRQHAVVLLTNRVYPTRESSEIKKIRPLFHDAFIKDWNSLNP